MTPMEQGLRVVGTVEFGGLKNHHRKEGLKFSRKRKIYAGWLTRT